jgi:hypothetical protein
MRGSLTAPGGQPEPQPQQPSSDHSPPAAAGAATAQKTTTTTGERPRERARLPPRARAATAASGGSGGPGAAAVQGGDGGGGGGASGSAHTGRLQINGRGMTRHYWSCCGAKLEGALVADASMQVEDARAGKTDAMCAGGDVGAAERMLAAAKQNLDQHVERLRGAGVCSAARRQRWKDSGMKEYMQHVYEFIKTEEVYVRRLLLLVHVYYEPLATGSHNAPQLTPLELGGLFSTLKLGAHHPPAHGVDVRRAGEVDLVSFHATFLLRLLLEEESREEVPDIGNVFQVHAPQLLDFGVGVLVVVLIGWSLAVRRELWSRKLSCKRRPLVCQRVVVGKPLIEHMNMYHPRNRIVMIGTLDWLRFTYVYENRSAELCAGAGTRRTPRTTAPRGP